MNLSFFQVLTALEDKLDTEFTASVVITGLTVVFLGLLLLVFFVWMFGKFFTMKKTPKASKTQEAQPEALKTTAVVVEAPAVEDGISDEIVAVITATVTAMSAESGKPLAVKSVKCAGNSRSQRLAWSSAGLAENTRPF